MNSKVRFYKKWGKVVFIAKESTKSKTFYLHESKKGRKKNTSESELSFNNDSQVFDSIEGHQYYNLESHVHERGGWYINLFYLILNYFNCYKCYHQISIYNNPNCIMHFRPLKKNH